MKIERRKLNLGKTYFAYLFLVLFLQIIGVDGKNTMLELGWKAISIILTMLYVLYKNTGRFRQKIIWPCLIYALGQIIAVTLSPTPSFGTFVNCCIILSMTYMFFSPMINNTEFTTEDTMCFVRAFCVLMMYAVVFQFIINPGAVFNIFSKGSVYSEMLTSFFDNKQTFGMFLFVTVTTCCIGYAISKKGIYVALALIFFGMLFACSSRTALIACLVFILSFLLLLFPTNRKMSLLLFLLILSLITLIYLTPQLHNFVSNVLLETEATFNARTQIWEAAFMALKGNKLLFGYGEGNAMYAIWSINPSLIGHTHNGLIHVLITGGLIKFSLYVVVVFYSIHCSWNIRRHHAVLGNVLLASTAGVIAFSMGESLVLLDTSSPCVVTSILCVAFPAGLNKFYQQQANQGITEQPRPFHIHQINNKASWKD